MKRLSKRKYCRVTDCGRLLRPEDRMDGRCQQCREDAERRSMRTAEPQPMDKSYAELRGKLTRWKQEHPE